MEAHALCAILPEMQDREFKSLVEDIRAKGLLRAITMFEGKILDGRHRFKACKETGVSPRFEQYTGTDPAGFVASCCTHRSLNPTQRALIAAGFLEYERLQARNRQKSSLKQGDHSPVPVNLPERDKGEARDKAGARVGIGGKQVSDAANVIKTAAPEVIESMRSGEMALNEAKKIVHLNKDAQRKIVAMPKKQRARAVMQATSRSIAKKRSRTPGNSFQGAVDHGTPFLRTLLGGIERLALYAAELGLKDAASIASQFQKDMDWSSSPLTSQFQRCAPILMAAVEILEQQKVLA